MGIEGKTGSTGGGSDTNILNKNGVKAVNLGIGMKKAHTLERIYSNRRFIKFCCNGIRNLIKEA